MTRVGAVQICPEWNDHVLPMPATAEASSASSNTIAAPLPPNSSSSRFIVRPALCAICVPTAVEPVNDTMSTSAQSTSACPASGVEPVTMLTTPGGKPASAKTSASCRTASGSCGAGLITTV